SLGQTLVRPDLLGYPGPLFARDRSAPLPRSGSAPPYTASRLWRYQLPYTGRRHPDLFPLVEPVAHSPTFLSPRLEHRRPLDRQTTAALSYSCRPGPGRASTRISRLPSPSLRPRRLLAPYSRTRPPNPSPAAFCARRSWLAGRYLLSHPHSLWPLLSPWLRALCASSRPLSSPRSCRFLFPWLSVGMRHNLLQRRTPVLMDEVNPWRETKS